MLFNGIKGPIFLTPSHRCFTQEEMGLKNKRTTHSFQTDRQIIWIWTTVCRLCAADSAHKCQKMLPYSWPQAHLCFVYRVHPLFYLVPRLWTNMSSLSVIGTRHRIAHWTPWTGNFASFLVLQHHTDWKTRGTQDGKLLLSRTTVLYPSLGFYTCYHHPFITQLRDYPSGSITLPCASSIDCYVKSSEPSGAEKSWHFHVQLSISTTSFTTRWVGNWANTPRLRHNLHCEESRHHWADDFCADESFVFDRQPT